MITKIVYDDQWDEYIVRVWDDHGERNPLADYHAMDEQDAEGTMRAMHERSTKDYTGYTFDGSWSNVSSGTIRSL